MKLGMKQLILLTCTSFVTLWEYNEQLYAEEPCRRKCRTDEVLDPVEQCCRKRKARPPKASPKPRAKRSSWSILEVKANADPNIKGAEVQIDGKPQQKRAPLRIRLPVGRHLIEITKPGFEPFRKWITLKRKPYTISPTLKAEVKTGHIFIEADILGAEVFVDGKRLSNVAPTLVKNLSAGSYLVLVQKGPARWKEVVSVMKGKTVTVSAQLAKSYVGRLLVLSNVEGAQVFLDQKPVGSVPWDRKNVPLGEHLIEVQAPGHLTEQRKIVLTHGDSTVERFELKPLPGFLRVLSTPPGAEVIINGEPAGQTPFNDDEIDAGEHVVSVKLEGHYSFNKTIVVVSEQRTVVNTQLELIPTGPTVEDLIREQRDLSSFGGRALRLRRATFDFGFGYPNYFVGQITVGVGSKGSVGVDVSTFLRSFVSRTDFGARVRTQLVRHESYQVGLFARLSGGSNFIDNSRRNSFTFDLGALVSLSALGNVTVTAGAYFNLWSDRHCPDLEEPDTTPLSVCPGQGNLSPDDEDDLQQLGLIRDDLVNREVGLRLMLSTVLEVAITQRWNLWVLIEGAPLQSQRAAYTDLLNPALPQDDFGTYGNVGLTYKY